METSKLGLAIIKEFEEFKAEPYTCPAGKLTIGYGHVILQGEKFTKITEAEADTILAEDVKIAEKAVSELVYFPLSQWQFDALVSFVFNVGRGNFEKSTLLKCLQKEKYALAANEFMRWIYAGENKMAGLMARRRCEKIIFKAGS